MRSAVISRPQPLLLQVGCHDRPGRRGVTSGADAGRTCAGRGEAAPVTGRATRRAVLASAPALATLPALLAAAAAQLPAPPPVDAAELYSEVAAVDIYQRSVPSVATVYDVQLPRSGSGPAAGVTEGNGSGFMFDGRHLVTCYHVLSYSLDGKGGTKPGARVAKVQLGSADGGAGPLLDAVLVGSDRARDLAVLRLVDPPPSLSPLPLGRSADVRPGQLVLAIGSPFGFAGTLAAGVVSAVGRGFQSQTGSVIAGGIQTDAAINSGMSGGPVLDSAGRAIGIATAIFTPSAGGISTGVSFVLPIDTAKQVVGQLISQGRVARASLGIAPAPDSIAKAFGVASGVVIQSVDPGAAADRAGLLGNRRGLRGVVAGDVIVAAGGRRVASVFDLSSLLDACAPGQALELTVLRNVGAGDEQRLSVSVTLDEEK